MSTASGFLHDGPADARLTLLLAHGAGAPMDHPFMATIARGLGERGWRVVRFDFPYMQRRRATGRKSPPDTGTKLVAAFREAAATVPSDRLVVGGKSMGGRIASMLADDLGARGLVCLGYPFHPPGRPDKLRTVHLQDLATPALIVQGERDPFGTREEVPGYGLSEAITVAWLPDAGHSLEPRKRSGFTAEGHLSLAVEHIDRFLGALVA